MMRAGKRLADQGRRLPENDFDTPRLWYCRSCGRRSVAVNVPAGWYSLARHTGVPMAKPQRLGVYCSVGCLSEELPRLQGTATALGEQWQEQTSQYRQGIK